MNEKCENCHEMTRHRLELIAEQAKQIRDLLQQIKMQKVTISLLTKKCTDLTEDCDRLITYNREAYIREAAKTAQDNNTQLIVSVDLVKEISKNADHAARSLLRLSNSINVAVMSAAAKSARDERALQQGDADSSAAGNAEPSASERDK